MQKGAENSNGKHDSKVLVAFIWTIFGFSFILESYILCS